MHPLGEVTVNVQREHTVESSSTKLELWSWGEGGRGDGLVSGSCAVIGCIINRIGCQCTRHTQMGTHQTHTDGYSPHTQRWVHTTHVQVHTILYSTQNYKHLH